MKIDISFSKVVIVLIISICFVILISNKLILDREKFLLNELYESNINSMIYKLNTLIEDKKNTTTALAIAISQDYKIIDSLENKNFHHLKYDKLLSNLRKSTNYKNVWIEVFDKNSNLIYQSWNNKKVEKYSKKILNEVQEVIEVNEYDLSFVTRVPIIKNNKYLGYLNLSTKFNSIDKALKKENILIAVLVNKNISEKIIYPFSNKFYKKYYISNKNISSKVYEYLDELDLQNFRNFEIKKNNLIGAYKVKDLAYIYYFKNLDDIDTSSITSSKFNIYFLLLICILLVSLFFYMFNFRKVNELHAKLKNNMKLTLREKHKVKSLLDSQSTIILITNGEELITANKKLIEFYDCKNLDEFKEKYTCICTTFENYEKGYILEKDYDGKNWAEYILSNKDKFFKVAIYDKNKELRHFSITVVEDKIEKFMIVTLSDITKEIKYQEKLKNFNEKLEKAVSKKTSQLKELNLSLEDRIKKEIMINRQKDKIIYNQNKMASISELLNNIAHHWRQPLSVISSATSAIKLQKELDILEDDFFDDSCDIILRKSKYLSNTIDSFTNLFNKSEKLELRSISRLINSSLEQLGVILKENSIKVHVEIEDEKIKVYENDFKQAILHILNNSIKALNENTGDENKLILIKFKNNELSIQDNARGLDKNTIEKIFEPYFTTYHKSSGKGLGLYLVKEILLKQMGYEIKAFNSSFIFEGKSYKGLNLEIKTKEKE